MAQWIIIDGGSHALDEVKPTWTGLEREWQEREGGQRKQASLMSTDYVQSYGLGPGGSSEINQAWSRGVTKWTIASPPRGASFPKPHPQCHAGCTYSSHCALQKVHIVGILHGARTAGVIQQALHPIDVYTAPWLVWLSGLSTGL